MEKRRRWDDTGDEGGNNGFLQATPVGRKWDETPQTSSFGGGDSSVSSFDGSQKKKSRWDETPQSNVPGAMTPFVGMSLYLMLLHQKLHNNYVGKQK